MRPAAVRGRREALSRTAELPKTVLLREPWHGEAVASAENAGNNTHTPANELAKAEALNAVFPNLIFTYAKGHSPSV